ncbi:MAG: CopD family protein [Nitrospirae bacterium]|nr:CopD family protein [Nitrospirota bacterium]
MNLNIFILISSLLIFIIPYYALPEYAEITGQSCEYCHINPNGSGTLTLKGIIYKEELKSKGLYRKMSTTQKVIRFCIGFIHTITAIVWFGAIVYVHILLKPAYVAKGGLPRGELRLAWVSMFILAITGTLLTIARVPSTYALLHTRFGNLLLIKIALFFIMVTTATLMTFIIGPRLKKRRNMDFQKDQISFTPETLSNFDGKEGRGSYVAFKGTVYNFSASKKWKDGNHMKRHLAGNDLTAALEEAPHGEEMITAMPIVGVMNTSEVKLKKPLHERIFYFFAYFNLLIMFLIIFIISMWRWWI